MPREIPLKGQKYPMLKKTLDFIEAHFFKVYIQGPRFIHLICVKKKPRSQVTKPLYYLVRGEVMV